MKRKWIDAERAAALYWQGLTVPQIAERLGFRTGSVTRALVSRGIISERNFTVDDPSRFRRSDRNPAFPSSRQVAEAEKMAMPRVERDPCHRCGARGDYGCGHDRAPVGWCVG